MDIYGHSIYIGHRSEFSDTYKTSVIASRDCIIHVKIFYLSLVSHSQFFQRMWSNRRLLTLFLVLFYSPEFLGGDRFLNFLCNGYPEYFATQKLPSGHLGLYLLMPKNFSAFCTSMQKSPYCYPGRDCRHL